MPLRQSVLIAHIGQRDVNPIAAKCFICFFPGKFIIVFLSQKKDLEDAHLIHYPVESHHIMMASWIIESPPSVPLRTLDALHLKIAIDNSVKIIATADKIMGEAALLLDFAVVFF